MALSCSPAPTSEPCERLSCPGGERCNPVSRRCEPEAADAGDPGSCVTNADCSGSDAVCDTAARRCVGCLLDSDCSTGLCDPGSHQCLAQPDTCQTARLLDLSTGAATVRGNTGHGSNDTTGGCAMPGSVGPDLVYTFVLAEARREFEVYTTAKDSALRPVLELRSACEGAPAATRLGCSYMNDGAPNARLNREVPAGTYWLWVDGDAESAGAFELQVFADAPAPGDTCGTARVVPSFTGSTELTGDTRLSQSDSAASCGGAEAFDLVYRLDLAAPARVTAELLPLTPLFAPVLYLRRSPCESTGLVSQLGCTSGGPGTVPAAITVDVPRLDRGSYYLFVDGAPGADQKPSAGEFRLKLTLAAPLGTPANDTCAGAQAITPPLSGYGMVSVGGTTAFAVNDSAGCSGSSSDVVYSIKVPGPRRVTARVAPTPGSSLMPVVYLRKPSACDSELSADQVVCNTAVLPGSPASVSAPNLAAGTYYVWVDGAGASKGAFALTVELAAPSSAPSNDTCSAPQLLLPASGPVTVTGTTEGANIDALLSCQVGSLSPDVVYEIAVPTRRSLSLDLQAAVGSQLLPVMVLRSPGACTSNALADELACVYDDPDFLDRTVLNLPAVDPGNYFLWVNGDLGSHGPFTLRASLGPPVLVPGNDDCMTAATPLWARVAETGDTRAALNDTWGSCGSLDASGELAGDVVYQLTLAAPQTVTVTVTPDLTDGRLFRPAIYVRGPGSVACSSRTLADQKGCAIAASYGSPVSLTLPGLPAGTWSVWVDGAGLSSGKFSIKWQ
ncbi:MAG: hypothetical protein ACYC8T_24155 [Myxococcaceae bacterium]